MTETTDERKLGALQEAILASIQRNNLTASAVAPEDIEWEDKPWLECSPVLDLSSDLLSIEDQLQRGSCVSNALTSVSEALIKALKARYPQVTVKQLSRLFHYYWGRWLDVYTRGLDLGMTVKQGIEAFWTYGVCAEALWPYNIDAYNTPPSDAAMTDATSTRITGIRWLKRSAWQDPFLTMRRMQEALTLGYPLVIGMPLADEFRHLTGPMPHNYAGMSKAGAVNIGGHCVGGTGYTWRGSSQWLKCPNSWGSSFGDAGFAGLPMLTIATDAFDIAAITEINGCQAVEAQQQQYNTLISRLYVALFGRAPDAEGLTFWTARLAEGTQLDNIAWQMFHVEPARAYYPDTAPEAVARSFYVNVLGRAPNTDEVAYWSNKIANLGPGFAIAEMTSVTANYNASDPYGVVSSDRFNRRVRAARLYAEAGGGIAAATAAIQYVN